MSGGGGTSTIQQSDPWYGQQPYMFDINRNAQNLREQSPSQYYPGQTYLPWNQLQQSGINDQLGAITGQQQIANQVGTSFGNLTEASDLNSPLATKYQDALRNATQQNINAGLGSLTRNQDNQGNLLSLQLQRQLGQQKRAYDVSYGRTMDDLSALRERQMRDYDVSKNMLTEDLTRNILPGISGDAVGAGQAGSTRQGIAEGLALSNAQNRLSELGRTQDETLASQLRSSGLSLGDLARAQAENTGQTTQGNTFAMGSLAREQAGQAGNITNQLTSGANLNMADFMSGQYGQGIDAAKSALAMAPTAQAAYGMPGQSLFNIGQQVYGQQSLPLQEQIARYYYNQQAPWNDLGNYSNLIQGLPSAGTTSGQTDSAGNPIGGAIGGALLGGTLFPAAATTAATTAGTTAGGAVGGSTTGTALGPWGMAGGALLGYLMSQ